MFCALATGYLKENSRIKEDTIMGVVFSAMFALGIVLITKIHSNIHLDHIIYGDPLGASAEGDYRSRRNYSTCSHSMFTKRKRLTTRLFLIRNMHKTIGLPTKILHYGYFTAVISHSDGSTKRPLA